MRLIDEMLHGGTLLVDNKGLADYITLSLRETEGRRFILDNVADYFYSHEDTNMMPIEDIPNTAPPFSSAWYEYRLSRKNKEKYHADSVTDIGLLVTSDDISQMSIDEVHDILGLRRHTEVAEYVQENKDRIRWISTAIPFGKMRIESTGAYKAIGPLGMLAFFTEHDGTPMQKFVMGDFTQFYKGASDKKLADMGGYLRDYYVMPCLLGISFLHCKNVIIQDEKPNENIAKAHYKRKGWNLTDYKILDIQPMRKIIEHEASGYSHSLPRSLHIVRGHFKNYKEGQGLFGRHQGLYFWQAYARNKGSNRRTVKTYRVKEPVT